MADTMLSFALEKLSTLITAEAELLGGLSNDVRKLRYELESIKEVLKDAEKKAEADNGIRVWLTQLRESAYHIEDVIDQYLVLKQQQQQQQHSLQSDYNNSLKNQFLLIINKISKWVKSAVACITQLKPKHELSSKIKKILADIVEINNRRERYKLITTPDDSSENEQNWQDPRVSSLFKDESELFDFTRKKTQIFSWLNLEQQDDQDRTKIQGPRDVIAVVGMGGLGKTTLVRKVYEDKKVKEGFSVYAWVTVSQSYRWRDLLNSIFKQLQAEPSLQLDASDEHTIISKLRNHLQEKRYIVVFDDVWDSKLWVYVENALPNNKNCSRIMMTTREVDVGGAWNDPSGGHHLYKLEPLSAEASWDLYCHKTFGNANCPSQLENLSHEMVGKCEGLPLAIVAIAGLLSTKEKILSEWNKLYNSGFEIGSNPHFSNTTKILLFSYYKLPYYLKPCFLYLGMFPEDYILSSNRLVRLWIAENFIQNQRGKTVEEVAKEYLNELVNRSLIQVHVIDNPTERPQLRFRVHDILREIIILPKLDYLCFGQLLSENNSLTANKFFRRFSICTRWFQQ